MAAFIPSGKPSNEAGFTYLGVLFLIMLMGMGLASAGELWSTASRRDRERQLLWVGTQYAQALRSYYRSSPGLAQYPKELVDLLAGRAFSIAQTPLAQPLPGPDWRWRMDVDARVRRTHHRPQQPLHGHAAQAGGFPQSMVGLHRHGELQGLAVRGRESLPRWRVRAQRPIQKRLRCWAMMPSTDTGCRLWS